MQTKEIFLKISLKVSQRKSAKAYITLLWTGYLYRAIFSGDYRRSEGVGGSFSYADV